MDVPLGASPLVRLGEYPGGDGADDAAHEVHGRRGRRVVHRLLLLQHLHHGERQEAAAKWNEELLIEK